MKSLKNLKKIQDSINIFKTPLKYDHVYSRELKILNNKTKFLFAKNSFNIKNIFFYQNFYQFGGEILKLNFLLNLNWLFVIYLNNFFFFKNFNKSFKKQFILFLFHFIFIQSYKPITPSLRFFKNYFNIRFNKNINFYKFFLKKSTGRIYKNNKVTVLSKGPLGSFKKKSLSIRLKSPIRSFFVFLFYFLNKKKFFVFCKNISGSLFVLPHIYGCNLGNIASISNMPQRFWYNNSNSMMGSITFIKFLENSSIFSNIFYNDYIKYATSPGTFCQILDQYLEYNSTMITLPSYSKKLISGWLFIIYGRNSNINQNTLPLSKAGSLNLLGRKPKVRGVARNPVDHPHGGRTKTNQPEKSIWGWVAKKNK